MGIRSGLCIAFALACILPATSSLSQELPAIPPRVDPAIWGRANAPYTLKLTRTATSVNGTNGPQTYVSEMDVYRNSAGLVCEESFYKDGRLSAVSIKDPGKSTDTILYPATKTASVAPMPRPEVIAKVWSVERLPSRMIRGLQAEGFRFTRVIPAAADGTRAESKVTEEYWISNTLGVVLEQTLEDLQSGTTRTETVSQFKQGEPDPSLFKVDSSVYPVQSARSLAP